MIIESGTGNGKLAQVDSDNRLLTASFNIPFVHLLAKDYQKVFTVEGNSTPTPGQSTVLHMTNTSSTDVVVITRVTVQAVSMTGGTALPNSGTSFQLLTQTDYASGGLAAPVVNTTAGSAVRSGVVAYDSNPTLNGAGNSLGRSYPLNAAPVELRTEGSILVLPRQTFAIDLITDHTGGFVYASVGFAVVGADGYSG